MGKTEKVVVLAVVFIAALVLAQAFTRGSDEVEASDPLSGAQRILDLGHDASAMDSPGGTTGGEPVTDATAPDALQGEAPALGGGTAGEGQAPSLLLNAGSDPEPALGGAGLAASSAESALALEPHSDPSRPILVDTQGLRPSFLEDYMTYTLAAGDTWSSLAQRFYQDGRYTRNLHLANEDLEELTPGKDILVPVFDFIARDAGLQAADGRGTPVEIEEPAPITATTATPAAERGPAGKLLEYQVRSGDTLSDISVAVFGTTARWKDILDLNRDKLAKPESLQVGMKLKIPDGGKLPVTTSATKKPEAKPKTPERGEKTAATAKKKKVL